MFDRDVLRSRKTNSLNDKNPFIAYTKKDLNERLDLLDANFQEILYLGAYNQDLDEEKDLKCEVSKFDLVIYSLGLHWINNVQEFLAKIRTMLKPNGIFIGNFIGGASLVNLRKALIDAEIKTSFTHSLHISPFIHFDHLSLLLSSAGFAEIIVDYEIIELKFRNAIELMREIKKLGESNALTKRVHYGISKKMFHILNEETKDFYDQITLISFLASPNKNSIKLKL